MNDMNPNTEPTEHKKTLRHLATHGRTTHERSQAHDLLSQIELTEVKTVRELLQHYEGQGQWGKEEIQRQADDARAAVVEAGYIWDYWVESDMANIAGMEAEHARRFPDCTDPSTCPHIR